MIIMNIFDPHDSHDDNEDEDYPSWLWSTFFNHDDDHHVINIIMLMAAMMMIQTAKTIHHDYDRKLSIMIYDGVGHEHAALSSWSLACTKPTSL